MRSLLSGGTSSASSAGLARRARPLARGLLLGATLVSFGLTLPGVRAEDEAPHTGAAPQAEAVAWIDGWELGREKAAHSGRLMLVYVHRTSPH